MADLDRAPLPVFRVGIFLESNAGFNSTPATGYGLAYWAGVHSFAARHDILLNSPWLNETHIPLREQTGSAFLEDIIDRRRSIPLSGSTMPLLLRTRCARRSAAGSTLQSSWIRATPQLRACARHLIHIFLGRAPLEKGTQFARRTSFEQVKRDPMNQVELTPAPQSAIHMSGQSAVDDHAPFPGTEVEMLAGPERRRKQMRAIAGRRPVHLHSIWYTAQPTDRRACEWLHPGTRVSRMTCGNW